MSAFLCHFSSPFFKFELQTSAVTILSLMQNYACVGTHWSTSSKWRKIGNFNSVAVALRDLKRRCRHHGFSSVRIQTFHISNGSDVWWQAPNTLSFCFWSRSFRSGLRASNSRPGRRSLVFVQLCRLLRINLPRRARVGWCLLNAPVGAAECATGSSDAVAKCCIMHSWKC